MGGLMAKYEFETTDARREIMKKIKAKDTKTEVAFRKELWRLGIRGYRKNSKKVFGKPDLSFSKKKIAVFIDGEFWHGLEFEKTAKIKSNASYWLPKIERNIQRDKEVNERLKEEGWTVLRFPEKKKTKKDIISAANKVIEALGQKIKDADGIVKC
jgi:DNA mismatch endonuclease (patch repair protein)